MAIISKSLLIALGAMVGTINATNSSNETEVTETVWSFEGAAGWSVAQKMFDHLGPVNDVAFIGSDSFGSVSDDETMRKYNRTSGEFATDGVEYNDHTDAVAHIAVGGDYVATAGEDEKIFVIGGKCTEPCELTGAAASLMFQKDGSRLMAAIGSKVMVWSTSSVPLSNSTLVEVPGSGEIASAALAGDSLAVSSGDELSFFDATSGNATQNMSTECELMGLAFSADAAMIAGACNGKIYVYKKGAEGFAAAGSLTNEKVTALAWSPDGAHLAAGNEDGNLSVWQAADWSATPKTMTCSYGLLSLEFNAAGDLLLVGDNGGGVSLLTPPKPESTTTTVQPESNTTTVQPESNTTTVQPEKKAIIATGSVVLKVDEPETFCAEESSTTGFVKALAIAMNISESAIAAECVAVAANATNATNATRRLQGSSSRKLAAGTVTFEYTITLELGAALDAEQATAQLKTAVEKFEQVDKTELSAKINSAIKAAGGTASVEVQEISKASLFLKDLTDPSVTLEPIARDSTTTTGAASPTTSAAAPPQDGESAAVSSRHFAMSVIAGAVLASCA